MNSISNDLQELIKFFNGTGITAFLKTPLAPTVTVFYNNLDLYLQKIKLIIISNICIKNSRIIF